MADHQLVDRLSSIQGIRSDVAENIAAAYPTAERLSGVTKQDLTAIKGVGEVTANRIIAEFTGTGAGPSASAEQPASITAIDAHRSEAEGAEHPAEQIKVAAKVVRTGAGAVVDTVKEHLPEVKDNFGKAAGSVVDLGREVTRVIFRRAS